MNSSALPDLLEEPEKALDSFVRETFHDDRLLLNLLCREGNPYLIAILYSRLSCSQSKLYDPSTNIPISSESLSAFVHLVQTNTTSAAFSVLTMYSIRHRTLTDHPNSFNLSFKGLSYSDRHSHGIGKLTIPSPSPLQLIKSHRGPIPIEPTHSNKIPHPFHLEPTARRVG